MLAQSLKTVLRWLTLLLFSDLMLDVLRAFWHCTLWMSLVQIIRKRVLRSWLGVGLLGDFCLIPLLEREDSI